MALEPQRSSLGLISISACLSALALSAACGGSSGPKGIDANGDGVADDLGTLVDENGDREPDLVDLNKDGKNDGPAIDMDGDGKADAIGIDADCDGVYDSVDTNRDGRADLLSNKKPPKNTECDGVLGSGIGGSGNTSGSGNQAGSGTAGSGPMGGSGSSGPSQLGMGDYQGSGSSKDRYAEDDLFRNGVGYKFIANGWGSNWQSHDITWNGTSFTVLSLNGSVGENYSPAGYPTVFCGLYSEPPKQSIGTCGLPASVASLQSKSVRTGWRWKANGNTGQYNAAWDIWLGNGNSLSSYLMVWLRDPPGQQPAGAGALSGATIAGLPGQWTVWTGSVNGHPIVNYVKSEGQDLSELEFDVMDVYRDAMNRKFNLPGDNILAVAVGFEVWSGPITNLVSEDFYVDVQ